MRADQAPGNQVLKDQKTRKKIIKYLEIILTLSQFL